MWLNRKKHRKSLTVTPHLRGQNTASPRQAQTSSLRFPLETLSILLAAPKCSAPGHLAHRPRRLPGSTLVSNSFALLFPITIRSTPDCVCVSIPLCPWFFHSSSPLDSFSSVLDRQERAWPMARSCRSLTKNNFRLFWTTDEIL